MQQITKISNGIIHNVPLDMRRFLLKNYKILNIWNSLTPLARNEWICWCISVKQKETREKHIQQVEERLEKGQKRPCCWGGCPHIKSRKLNLLKD